MCVGEGSGARRVWGGALAGGACRVLRRTTIDSHTRLRSLGEGGCPVGDLPVNKDIWARE